MILANAYGFTALMALVIFTAVELSRVPLAIIFRQEAAVRPVLREERFLDFGLPGSDYWKE